MKKFNLIWNEIGRKNQFPFEWIFLQHMMNFFTLLMRLLWLWATQILDLNLLILYCIHTILLCTYILLFIVGWCLKWRKKNKKLQTCLRIVHKTIFNLLKLLFYKEIYIQLFIYCWSKIYLRQYHLFVLRNANSKLRWEGK